MTRSQIIRKFNVNIAKIKKLQEANIELNRQHLLFSDKNQQYREGEETHGRGKLKQTYFIGRVYWREYFLDEDTGDKIWIDRSKVVRQNNEWIIGL